MNYLTLENVTKSFGEKVLFQNVNLQISKGDKIALVAKNGSGKTTLLRVIAGEEAGEGELCKILQRKDIRVGYLNQEPDFFDDWTVTQSVFESENQQIKAVRAYEEAMLNPDDTEGMQQALEAMDDLKAFLQEQLRNAYDLKEGQIEQDRPGLMREAERFFILQQIDTLWREHLQAMDALRESVGLRGYGQKDPLIEYKNEGYDMFLEMMTNMRRNVIYSMFMFQPAPSAAQQTTNA